MIEQLKWDSDFFGYPVGRILLTGDKLSEDITELNKFKLIYLFSDNKLNIIDEKISEVDIKTTLIKQIAEKAVYPMHSLISEYAGGQDEMLKILALESGIYSRFKRDPLFINDEFTKLYTRWMVDSIAKKIADRLIIYQEKESIEGFVSVKFKDTFAEIGLIAVDGLSRGKGIAMALLNAAFNLTQLEGLPCIRIVTQFENTPAMKLYQKAGFEIENQKYIYHLWN